MKLEQSFEVAAPIDQVWKALIDVEHVAPCLPGAAVTGRNQDGSYSGTFTVKIGPTTASYTGKLDMETVDEETRTATMSATGSDKRGQGGATAKIFSKLEAVDDSRTRVEVDTDYHITGRLARFGRGGMIEDISERLLKEFAKRLADSLEGSDDAAPTVEIPAVDAEEDAQLTDASRPMAQGSAPQAGLDPDTPPEPPAPTDAPEPPAVPEPPRATEPPPPRAAEPAAPAAAETPPNEPLDATSLVGSVVADRVKANPWPVIGGAVLIVLLLRRRRRR